MAWVMTGVAAVGIVTSVAGNISANKAQKAQNRAIEKSAQAQNKLKTAFLNQSMDIQMNELVSMTDAFDKEVGIDLTNLLYESEKMKGAISTTLAERNITGNTASRMHMTADIQKELSNDMIQDSLQNKYNQLNKEIFTAQRNYEREALDIQLGLAGSLSQQNHNFKSGTNMALEATSAGINGYLTGSALSNATSGAVNTVSTSASKA